MDPRRTMRKNYHILRRLKHVETEKNKYLDLVQKEHQQQKVDRAQQLSYENKLKEYKVKTTISVLEKSARDASADKSRNHRKPSKKLTRKKKRRSRQSLSGLLSQSPHSSDESSNTKLVEETKGPRQRAESAGESTECVPCIQSSAVGETSEASTAESASLISKLSEMELDSGVSSDDSEPEDNKGSACASAEDRGHVRAVSVCSAFDTDELQAMSMAEITSGHNKTPFDQSRFSSTGKFNSDTDIIGAGTIGSRSKHARYVKSQTRKKSSRACSRGHSFVEQTFLTTGESLHVQGVNLGRALTVRQCLNSEPEAISSVRRPIPSKHESLLKKMVTKFFDEKPVDFPGSPPAVERYVPPYPVYFKSAVSSLQWVKGTSLSLIQQISPPNKNKDGRPYSAYPATRLPSRPEMTRAFPHLTYAPRRRPVSAPAKTMTTPLKPCPPPPRSSPRPLKVEVATDHLREEARSAPSLRPRAQSAKLVPRPAVGTPSQKPPVRAAWSQEREGPSAVRIGGEEPSELSERLSTSPACADSDSAGSSEDEFVMRVVVTKKKRTLSNTEME